MPNPKLGTVTMDVAKAVKDAKGGQVEFRVEKAGIVHAGIGKASLTSRPRALKENFSAFMDAIIRAKPSGAKGKFVKKLSVSSTIWARSPRSTLEEVSRSLNPPSSGPPLFGEGWMRAPARRPEPFYNPRQGS